MPTPKQDVPDAVSEAIQRRLAFEAAPAWRPTPGDIITGKLAAVRQYVHEEYGPSKVAVLDVGGDYVSVYLIHDVLSKRLHELRPPLGELITIQYSGEVQGHATDKRTGDPIRYHSYVVFVGEPDVVSADAETLW